VTVMVSPWFGWDRTWSSRLRAGISGERAAELGEVLRGEAFDERPGGGRLWHNADRPVAAGCHHGNRCTGAGCHRGIGESPYMGGTDRAGQPRAGRAMAAARWTVACSDMASWLHG